MPFEIYRTVFAAFAFILGAIVGSFLNVCIYRLPRNLRVDQPKRSFCPNCEKQIPWHQNLPIFSWLLLRGKCASCKKPISPRYLLVEALTGLLFLAVFFKYFPEKWILLFPLFIFISLLIVATFIDFEHFIIPDIISWGGAVVGVICSLAIPLLHKSTNPVEGFGWSLFGAITGFLTLFVVVKLGKLAFGRKNVLFKKPQPLTWKGIGKPPEKDADFSIGDDKYLWTDFFVEKDKISLECESMIVDGVEFKEGTARFSYDNLEVGGKKFNLDNVNEISGIVRRLSFSREAMGFGDVALMTCIGAFLGWRGVLFTIFAGSVTGSVIGVLALFSNMRALSAKVPFGPYLSLGALIWIFFGPELVEWYFNLMRPPI